MILKKFFRRLISNPQEVLSIVKFAAFLLLILTVVFLSNEIAFFFWNEKINPEPNYFLDFSKIGHVGDLIGGLIGSLWALAGVLLFYQAMNDQKKATNLLSEQVNEQKVLQFETVLFNLFNNYRSRVGTLKHIGNNPLVGDDIFREIVKEASQLKFKDKNTFREVYNSKIHKKYSSEIHTMVYGLYSILKYINNIGFSNKSYDDPSEVKKNNVSSIKKKLFYGELVKAQLSLDQLAVVLYECACNEGSEKLVHLIEKYEILSDKDLVDDQIDQGSNFKAQAIWEMHWEIARNLSTSVSV